MDRKTIKTIKLFLLLLVSITVLPLHASYKFGFIDTSINYLQWTPGTKARSGPSFKEPGKTNKQDLPYLELEGGAEFSWGEIYGFGDLERVFNKEKYRHTALKGSVRVYLPLADSNIYAQVYDYREQGFYEQNRVIGIGYNTSGNHWWFKPWIGIHNVSQTFYKGMNGAMAGWVLAYDFKVQKLNFLITNWHEIEFLRQQEMTLSNGGRTGINGALALWWQINKHIATGGQWRYAYDKLGQRGDINAGIATLKYFFDLPQPSLEE